MAPGDLLTRLRLFTLSLVLFALIAPIKTLSAADGATFVSDGTYTDGYDLYPNTTFTKTWTIRNSGTTTWNSGYYIQRVSGDQLATSNSNRYLTLSVPPGISYIFSVAMRSPITPGNNYRERWSFKSPSGTTINVSGSSTIWALIDVLCPSGNGRYCGATLGLNSNTLYQCTNGSNSVYEICSYGCQTNAPGTDDVCSPPPPPSTPSTPSASATGPTSIDISWGSVSGANNYRLYRSTSSGDYGGQIYFGPSLSRTDSGTHLSPNTTYYYRVRASNSSGDSGYSSYRLVTTPPAPPNLTANFIPSGWSYPIVPTNSSGSRTVSTLSACSTTYINWAVRNETSNAITSQFHTYLYIDGSYVTSWYTNTLNGWDWTQVPDWPRTFTPGNHTLRIVTDATSVISETSESDNWYERPFYWNDCNPVAYISSPQNGDNFTVSSISVNGTCTDGGQNLSSAQAQNVTTGWSGSSFGISGSSASFSISGIPLISGANTIRLTCRDGENRTSTWDRTVFYTPPNNSPTTTVSSPANGFTTEGSFVTLSGNCYDSDGNLSSVNLTNNTVGYSTGNSFSGSSVDFSGDLPLAPGSNSLTATCSDSFGASHSSSLGVIRDVCPDGSLKDYIGNDNCNHNEDGDNRSDYVDSCPTDPDDGVGSPCNHNDCADLLERDGVGDACIRNDCADLSLEDGVGNLCDHNDCSNLSAQDNIGDPCNHNDCADLSFEDNVGDPCIHNDCADGSLEDGTGNICNHTDCPDGTPEDPWGVACDHTDCPDLTAQDDVGTPCNHNDCADLTLRDSAGDACNHSDCPDNSPQDDWGNVCNHHDCPDGSLQDGVDDVCNHDQDGDQILDSNDLCPRYTNDTVNNPCNPDDNANLVFEGGEINVTVIQGEVNQTQQFNVTNNGTGNMVYTFSRDEESPWLNLVKNGGETNTFTEPTHTLAPGQSDQYTVTLVSNSIPAETRVANTIILASNDTSSGTASVPISMSVEAAPYCPLLPEQLVCRASPAQTLGNQSSNVQNFSDPVNTATGNFSHHHTDLTLAGRGLALSFSRTYNSQDKYIGPLGYGWTHTYNILLSEFSDGTVQTRWGDGHFETYIRNEDGTYEAPKGIFSNLVKTDDQFTLTTKNYVTFQFSNKGRLSSIQDRQGNRLDLTYDEKNRLTQVADLIGRTLSFAYEGEDSFKLTSVTDLAGRSVSFSYNGDDLISTNDVLGNTTRYEYDSHRMTKVIDPLGNSLVENAYDDNARVIEQRDGKGSLSRLAFESPEPGHVVVTDPLGQTMRQVYDDRLRVVESTDPVGRAVLYQYNETNLRTQVTDRRGQNLKAEYDERGNLISLTDPLGAVTRFEHDPETEDLLKAIEPNNHERNFEYDDEGNLVHVWEELEGEVIETHYAYNEWGQLLTSTDALENTTTYRYDSAGNLESITDPVGGMTQFDHDNAGQLMAVTDPLNRTTQFEYDADGRTTRVIDSVGSVIRYEYDANGNIVRFTDRNGQSTELEWNENNFLEVFRDALGNETSFVYDSLNRKTQMTDPENRTVHFEYDAAGNLTSMTDPSGRITHFTHDNEGNLASETDTAGEVTSYSYDSVGRLIRVTDPLENTTDHTYDFQTGLLTQTIDAEGQVVQYEYDELGRLTAVVDPLDQRITFEYDLVGNLASLANPSGHTTTFTYDSLGRLISQTNALGETEQYSYDLASQLNRFVDKRGQETRYSYDLLGRPISVLSDDESEEVFTYDSEGNRLSRQDILGITQYTYDALGRLTSLQDPRGFQIGYGYGRTGLISRLTYPGDRTIQYTYDASGQLNQLTDWLGNTTTHTYDTAGRLDRVVYPNGFKTTYEYDSASRLTRLENRRPDESLLSSYEFTLDRLGNRIEVEKEEPLTPWISPEDLAANYNEENELLALGDMTFDYDANGNLILANASDGDTHYSFDAQDRLSSILSPVEETTFGYDGDGNRVSLTRAGETTRFVVDPSRGLPDVIAETDGNDAIQSFYVYGLGLNAQISADGSQIHYYHYDPIGSTIALSNAAGDVTDQYLYDEFGAVNRRTGSTENPFQFVGQFGVQNDGNDLHYMRARYYDSMAGRFISPDPSGYSDGLNLFEYAGSNPLTYIDPTGYGKSKAVIKLAKLLGKGIPLVIKGNKTTRAAIELVVKNVLKKVPKHLRKDIVSQSTKFDVAKRQAKRIADAAAKETGLKAEHHIPHIADTAKGQKNMLPHYKVGDTHIFYRTMAGVVPAGGFGVRDIAEGLTVENYAGEDSLWSYFDYINPFSLPQDLIDLVDFFFGTDPDAVEYLEVDSVLNTRDLSGANCPSGKCR